MTERGHLGNVEAAHGSLMAWAKERGQFVRVDRATPWANSVRDGRRYAPAAQPVGGRRIGDWVNPQPVGAEDAKGFMQLLPSTCAPGPP